MSTPVVAADKALARLREGNHRFAAGTRSETNLNLAQRAELAEGQNPFAIIFGCSDSRVPPEIVFDQGLGDLFVIRVAGNIVAPAEVGSIEFAAAELGARLVVVLGHTQCGAVRATLAAVEQPTRRLSQGLRAIVDEVRPAVEDSLRDELIHDRSKLVEHAVRANIATAVDRLRHGSEPLRQLIEHDGLRVVGAEYSLETGKVEFFEGAL